MASNTHNSLGPLASFPNPGLFSLYLPEVNRPPVSIVGVVPLIQAVYHNGQTFITWPERTDLNGERYRIYRSDRPIASPSDLPKAHLLAEVSRGSARFYANRYHSTQTGAWLPRYLDRLVIADNQPPLSPGTGLLVWTLSPDDLNGRPQADGYYSVTVVPAGGSEIYLPQFTAAAAESVADPQPVEITGSIAQIRYPGEHIYIQYMDLRHWNATFHAPNPSNQYYGLDPADPTFAHALQYAYDYVVYTPTPEMCGGALPARLPVFFHLHGWTDIANPPADRNTDSYCAYGVYPVDVTNTWYFGFAQRHDYRLGGEVETGDVIENYTEQRLLRMLVDLMRDPPGPPADPQRVYVAGQSMGGTGALSLAERYPNIFAAAYSCQPMTDFLNAGVTKEDWVADVSIKWGKPSLNLPIYLAAPSGYADHLQPYNGTGVWDWENLQKAMIDRPADDLVPLGVAHGTADHVIPYDTQVEPFYPLLDQSRQAWAAIINSDKHEWQYYAGLPPTLSKIWEPFYTMGVPFWNLAVIRDETVPGLSHLSGNSPLPPGGLADYNQTIAWSASWHAWDGAPIDQPDRWQMSLCAVAAGSLECGAGVDQTVDITPRRLQRFHVTPGATYAWQNQSISDGVIIAAGSVTAASSGLITVPSFSVSPTGNRLIIQPQ